MLNAALLTDVSQIDSTARTFLVDGTIAYSGSYPTNGDTLDLSQLGIPSNSVPIEVCIFEATPGASAPAYGAQFVYLPGSSQANGLMEMFNGTAQIATATYATIFGAIPVALKFQARFTSFV
jgi:hypothetical protein